MNKEKTLKDDWRILKFSECIKQLNTGLNPRNHFSLGNGKIKYITAKNLTQSGIIDFSNCDYIDEDAKKIINKRSEIKVGDILFSSRAPIGHCHLIKDEPDYFDIGESIFSIRVNNEIVLPEYLCLYLSSSYFIELASKNTTGSIIQEIRISDLMNTSVIIPPKETQKCIAQCLNTIDQKIENNNKINAELEAMAKTIYDYWFLQFEFPNEEGKPYKSSGGKMVWNEELKREIPEGWEVKCVLELFNWVGTSQPPKSMFIYEEKDGYIRFIQNRDYDNSNHKTYIPLEANTKTCDEYDIMIDKYGDAGKTRYGLAGAYNVALSKIVPFDVNMREFLRGYLSSENVYNYLHAACMASTRASLNEDNFAFLTLAVPSSNVVNKFNEIALPIIQKQMQIKKENKELASLRDFLLPMLMNGQIGFKINNRKE